MINSLIVSSSGQREEYGMPALRLVAQTVDNTPSRKPGQSHRSITRFPSLAGPGSLPQTPPYTTAGAADETWGPPTTLFSHDSPKLITRLHTEK